VELGTLKEPGSGFLSLFADWGFSAFPCADHPGLGVREPGNLTPSITLVLISLFVYSFVWTVSDSSWQLFFSWVSSSGWTTQAVVVSRRNECAGAFLSYLIFGVFLHVYFPGGSWGFRELILDALSNLAFGFSIFLQPITWPIVLSVSCWEPGRGPPGLGPSATISLLLPIIFHADPVSSIIMLAGICYGAQYGGSTTSILLNIPGRLLPSLPASTVTRWPSREGRSRPRDAAFGSFIAGTIGVCGLMLLGPPWPI